MIIVESTFVDPAKRTNVGHLGISNDHYVQGMNKLATAYYDYGGIPVAPSELDYERNPKSSIDYPVRELPTEEIRCIVKEFGLATRRAIEAGFSGIEIHSANHFLLQQFFSKNTNRRIDEYGGNLTNRMRFILEIVDEVVKTVYEKGPKDFIIGIRLSLSEMAERIKRIFD